MTSNCNALDSTVDQSFSHAEARHITSNDTLILSDKIPTAIPDSASPAVTWSQFSWNSKPYWSRCYCFGLNMKLNIKNSWTSILVASGCYCYLAASPFQYKKGTDHQIVCLLFSVFFGDKKRCTQLVLWADICQL